MKTILKYFCLGISCTLSAYFLLLLTAIKEAELVNKFVIKPAFEYPKYETLSTEERIKAANKGIEFIPLTQAQTYKIYTEMLRKY